MIIDKFVKIKIGGRNIKHFKNINPEYKISMVVIMYFKMKLLKVK